MQGDKVVSPRSTASNEYLVTIEIRLPADLPVDDRAALEQAERAAGRRLVEDGAIVRIWRLPGRRANVGIWRARDPTHLHELLSSLPMASWMDVEVVPLAVHPLEAEE